MKFNRLGAFILGVVVTAASVGATSLANASGGSTMKACANKSSGAMRFLSKGSCKSSERLLTWNQQGPSGPAGSSGPAGPSGPAGSSGPIGAAGPAGATGARGATGSTGSSASVSTQSVTLRYLGAQGFNGIECGSGTMTAYKPGYAYWGMFLDAWTSTDLQNSSRWTQLRSCEITLKVVSP
jgi:hypothetical protein